MEEKRQNTADSLNPGNQSLGTVQPGDAQSSAGLYSSDLNKYYLDSSLEVREQSPVVMSNPDMAAMRVSRGFTGLSRRKALVVSAIITLIVTFITGASILLLARNAPDRDNANAPQIQTQDVSLKDADLSNLPEELQGAEKSLLVNGDIISRSSLKVVANGFVTTLKPQDLTGNQSYNLPNASGTICLDSNNCGYATAAELGDLQGQLGLLGEPGLQSIASGSPNLVIVNDGNGNVVISQTALTSGVDSVNGASGALTIQGTPNQVTINPSGNTFTLSTPQDINQGASPIFAGLTLTGLDCSSNLNAGALTAVGGVISCSDDDGGAGAGLTGSGTVGVIPLFTGSTTNLGNSVISQTLGNISIGGNLSLGTSNVFFTNAIQQTANGQNVSISAGANVITFTAGGRDFVFPTTGAASQTICTTGITCASGGGTAVILGPTGGAQNDNTADASIFINDTGGGELLRLQVSSSNRFVVANDGSITGGTLNGQTISSAASFTGSLAVQGGTATFGTTAVGGTLTSAANPGGLTRNLTVTTGNAGAGNSGDLFLATGTATGTRGSIRLDAGGANNATKVFFTGIDCSGFTDGGTLTVNAMGQLVCSNDDTGIGDGVGALNLQEAYDGGSTITATNLGGDISFAITEARNFITNVTGSGAFIVQGGGNNALRIESDGGIFLGTTNFQSCTALETNANGEILCGSDAGGGGLGDNIAVNGTGVNDDVNILNTAASATAAATTWTLNTGVNPNQLTLALGVASASDAGIVTAQGQTFGGLKTFANGLTVTNGQNVTIGNEVFTELTGNGLQRTSGSALALIDCTLDQVLKWNGSGQWACAADDAGDGVGASNLQEAYEGNGAITATNAEGDIVFTLNEATDFITNVVGSGAFVVQGGGSNALSVASNGDITIADIVGCDALETDGSGVLVCGTDNGGDGVGATTLQEAYDGGNTITADDLDGSIDFTLSQSTDFIVDLQTSGNTFEVQSANTTFFTFNQDRTIGYNAGNTGELTITSDLTGGNRGAGAYLLTVTQANHVTNNNSAGLVYLENLDTASSGAVITIQNAGTGADIALDAASLITIANGGTLNITDGTNTLFTLADGGMAGNLTATGNLQIDGNLTLGSSNADTITIYAGQDGAGITFVDPSFQGCTALETNGSGVLVCGDDEGAGPSPTLQNAYSNGAAGDQTITFDSTRDSIHFLNPAASGSSSGFMLHSENTATNVTLGNFTNTRITSTGSFDTTGGNLTNYGLYVNNSSTESAGGNVLTNVGLYVNASGGNTNYAALFMGGNIGIGDTTPVAALTVGDNDLFQVDGNNGNVQTAGTLQVAGNVTVGANSVIRLTGGNTANRPSSPQEGMLYFDTDTDTLLVYSNGKWQADRSDAILVAANNSRPEDKDAADYVADGTGDEVEINAALALANPTNVNGRSGKVFLFAGTYTVGGTILIPNNTTLAGAGRGTFIELANLDVNENIIENSDTTTGTGVTIQDISLNGRKDLNTSGDQAGIYLSGMGDVSTSRPGAKMTNLWLENFTLGGIVLFDSDLNTMTSNIGQNNNGAVIVLLSSNANTLTGNTAQGSTSDGFVLFASTQNTLTGNVASSNGQFGFALVASSSNNTFTGNNASNNGSSAFSLNGSNSNNISGNTAHNNGGSLTGSTIAISTSSNNLITNNRITDTAGTGHAISINSGTANYLADNYYTGTGATTINDAGTGTIYGGQLNSSGNYIIEPGSGTVELQSNTNITGALVATGNGTFSGGSLTVGATSTQGTLFLHDGTGGHTVGIRSLNQAANRVVEVPVIGSNDTFCLVLLNNCASSVSDLQSAYVGGNTITTTDADNSIIFNLADTTDDEDFIVNIQGTGNTFEVQDGGTSVLTIADGGTSTFNGNVVLAATRTLRITGSTTANRPGSPTEGMLYFDTDTDQLLVYANGKWQADRSETVLVAASNSSQAAKDSADYVADGNGGGAGDGDQVQINAALTAAAAAGGKGKVYLFAGTYVADDTILVPNNTTLAGAGRGTLIELADIDTSADLIKNSDTGAGTGVTIRDLRLDGRSDLNTGGSQHGISLESMGESGSSPIRPGATLTNIAARRFRSRAFNFYASDNNTLTGNTAYDNEIGFDFGGSSSNNTLTGNTAYDNTTLNATGFRFDTSNNNTLTGNTAKGNSNGFSLTSSSNNTLTGNTAQDNGNGFSLNTSNNNTLTGNTLTGNTSVGLYFASSSNSNTVSNNNVHNNGGATTNGAIVLDSSDSNTISGNNITDTSCSGSCWAISIQAGSDTNYLADNQFNSPATINDAGTGTIYGGQLNGSGNYVIEPGSGTVELQSNTNITGTLVATGNGTFSGGSLTVGATAQQGTLFLHDGTGGHTVGIRSLNQAANRVVEIPIITGNDTFCLVTLNNCAGTATTLQQSYTADPDGGDVVVNMTAADGAILFRDAASSIGQFFAVQSNGGSSTYLSVSSTRVTIGTELRVGDSTNRVDVDASTKRLRLAGTAQNDVRVTMEPEYHGLTLNGSGVGYLTSNFCSDTLNINDGGGTNACSGSEEYNYYEWTTSEASAQTYNLYIRYRLPDNFASFFDNNTINLTARSTDHTDSNTAYAVFRNNVQCGSTTTVNSSTNAWTTTPLTGSENSCGFVAGDTMTIRIAVTANTSDFVRVGRLEFVYKATY